MEEIKELESITAEKRFNAETDWDSTFSKFSVDKEKSKKVLDEVIEMYDSKDRIYHNLKHIEKLLTFLEQDKDEIEDYNTICMAAWFHDVVYDTKSKDNEEQSAIFARKKLEELGIQENIIAKVEKLIRATYKHENIDDDNDCSIFLDGDLAILAESENVFDSYAKAIRQEYHWVPEDIFNKERKNVLEKFLIRDRIYFTEKMFKESETKARNNIKREIESLK
jgi:predicted metal-dependent HD superfamily phosphohydrolase